MLDNMLFCIFDFKDGPRLTDPRSIHPFRCLPDPDTITKS